MKVHWQQEAVLNAKPDEKLRFEFTTTSKAAQERLGIKK